MRIVERVLRAAVPALADFALVHVVAAQSIVGIAAAHGQPGRARTLRELMRMHRLRISDSDSAVAHVIRTGRPLIRSGISREPFPSTRAGDHAARTPGEGRIAELHRRLAPRSALVIPIVIRGSVLGAVSLCCDHSRRRDAALGLALARRLALQIGYVLMMTMQTHGAVRLPTPARHARQGTALRRRVAARN